MNPLFAFLGILLLRPDHRRPRPMDDLWDEDTPIPPDHPLVPEPVREAAAPYIEAGCVMHRVQTCTGIEWWLFDQGGDLVEAIWLKNRRA